MSRNIDRIPPGSGAAGVGPRLKRIGALASGFAVSVAGIVAATTIAAPSAVAGPPVVRGTTQTEKFVSGPPMADGTMAQSFRDVQLSTRWRPTATMPTGTPPSVYALPGDDVTWWSGVTAWSVDHATRWAPPAASWILSPPPIPGARTAQGLWPIEDGTPGSCTIGDSYIERGPVGVGQTQDTVMNEYCVQDPRDATTAVGTYRIDVTNVPPKSCTDYRDNYYWGGATAYWVEQADGTVVQTVTNQPGATNRYGGPDNRMPGINGVDSANLYVVNPRLEVIKEVCSTGTGCDATADLPQYTVQPDSATGCDDIVQYQDNGGQWVKSQMIPAGSPQVQWRITAVNTGNVALNNVHVATDAVTAADPADSGVVPAGGNGCQAATIPGSLAPGAAASTTCVTSLNGNLHGPLTNSVSLNATFPTSMVTFQSQSDETVTPNPPLLERFTGNPTPADPNGEPNMVPSGVDQALVDEQIPAIAVTKWVCEPDAGGPGDTPDTTPDTTCADPGADPTLMAALAAGTPTGGWAKAANVPYSQQASWAVVVTNTGDTWLKDVTLTDQLGPGGGHGALSGPCVSDPNVGQLGPGQSASRLCLTAGVTNGNPITATDATPNAATPTFACGAQNPCPASAQPVINQVSTTGQPLQTNPADGSLVLVAGQPVPINGLNNQPLPQDQWPKARDWAQAHALPFHPGVEVTKYDTLVNPDGSTDDAVSGDHNQAPGRGLTENSPTTITVTIRNNGDEPLKHIVVTDAHWTGPGSPTDFGLTCDFSPLGGPATGTTWDPPGTPAQPYFQPGASFTCTGTVPGLAPGEAHSDVVNVTADGVFSTTPVTDHNPWNGFAPTAGVHLTKWVCDTSLQDPQSATNCAVPGGAVLASLAAGTPAGHWHDQATVPYQKGAVWTVVVTNTGQTDLADVKIIKEDLAAGGGGHGNLAGDCLAGSNLNVLNNVPSLKPGESLAVTCTTDNITNDSAFGSGQDVVNTAQAKATPVYPVYGDFDLNGDGVITSDEMGVAQSPVGQAGEKVVAGDSYLPDLTSNQDTAEVRTDLPNTAVVITKYDTVGNDGVPVNGTYPGDYDVAPGKVLAPEVPTPIGFTVTNTGEEPLIDLVVGDVTTDGPYHVTNISCDFSPHGGPSTGTSWAGPLAPGDSIDCTGTLPAMPAGAVHSDTATVTASGQLTGREVTDDNDWNGHVPQPGIELTKWVCQTGTGCAVPANDSAVAASLSQGRPDGGWVKEVTVSYGTPAQWLLVVTNTGNTVLTDVNLIQEGVTGATPTRGGEAQTTPVAYTVPGGATYQCAAGSDLGRMAVGAVAVLSCQTLEVTSTEPLGSGRDVVNTAAAVGTPADNDGNPILVHDDLTNNDVELPPVETGPDSADANTTEPTTDVTIDKHDTVGGDGTPNADGNYPGAYDEAPGRVLQPGTPTPITITVTNTGTEDLVDVVVTDTTTVGPVITGLSCDFSAAAAGAPTTGTTWAGPFHPGASFECTGTVPAMAAGEAHSDTATVEGQGAWTGRPVEHHNDWNGRVPNPKLDLAKWVCQQGTGCAVPPTAADLAALAQGRPAGGWVKATKVVYRADAQWLIVVTNTGDTALANVTLTREDFAAGGAGHGATGSGCALGTNLGTLEPGASATVTCTTATIVNAAGHGSHDDVVNTAQAKGSPVDADGQPVVLLDAGPVPDVSSPESSAEVNTEIPVTKVTITKYDTLDGDNEVTGDYNDAPGKTLSPGQPTPISFTVTNSGTEDLVDLVVTDTTTTGPAITGLTCDFSALGGPATGTTWAGPFHPGASFTCTGTVPAMEQGKAHSDKATVTGTGAVTGQPASDDDTWNGQTAGAPAVSIKKFDTLDGDDAVTGDYNTAPGKLLNPGVATPIQLTITNSGQDALVGVVVQDVTDAGPRLTDLSCDFSALGGPATGTTWDGPLAVGAAFTCTATLPGLAAGAGHADTAVVTATGQHSGQEVSAHDPWNGRAPKASLDLTKWVCQLSADCAAPSDAVLAQLASGFPAGGWVKATSVTHNGKAQWLLIVTNTGDTVLTDVTLTREDLDAGGAGHGATTAECAVGKNLGRLDPGKSITLTCSTADITNTAALGSGDEVVNTAQAKGTPSDSAGQPLVIGHTRAADVVSPEDEAAATTEQPPAPPPPPAPPTPPKKPIPALGAPVTGGLVAGGVALVALGASLLVATGRRRRRGEA